MDELSDGLQSNNIKLAASNENIFLSLKMKADDPRTAEKMAIWLPKAEYINTISSQIVNYLDSLQTFLVDTNKKGQPSAQESFARNGVGKEIYRRLKGYKDEIFALHENLLYSIGEVVNRTLFNRDSLLSADEYERKYFNYITIKETTSYLSLLQNKILLVTNASLQWCHEQVVYHGEHFETFEAIVGQNAKILEVGDDLEITAGLGTFQRSKLPEISINNQLAPLTEYGLAIQKIKTSKKAGNYSLPVQVSFLDQDGRKQTRSFIVDYRLVERIKN